MPKNATIRLFHATTAGALPPAGSLTAGELALDSLDSPPHLYALNGGGTVIDLLSDGAPTLPLSIADGGTGATTANGALSNLANVTGATAGVLQRNAAGQWSVMAIPIISATAPVPAIDGQLWFDTVSLQTFLRYNDGVQSQWVPVNDGSSTPSVSPYLPLSGGALTGPLTLVGNAAGALNPVPLQQLTSTLANYVTSSALTTALGSYLPINNPAFTGNLSGTTTSTWTFPDGSTYTSAGHNNMRAIGVGVPAVAGLRVGDFAAASVSAGTFGLSAGTYYDGANWRATASLPSYGLLNYFAGAFSFHFNTTPTAAGGIVFFPASTATLSPIGLGINGEVAASALRGARWYPLPLSNGWYMEGDPLTGTLAYHCELWMPNGLFWVMRNDQLCFNQVGAVAGYGPYIDLCDERGKRNLAVDHHGLDSVRQLNPVMFDRVERRATKAPPPDMKPPRRWQHREIGFNAQDVQQVIPEAVVAVGIELPDGTGGPDSDQPSLGLMSSALIAVLVNAVKELDQKVTALESK